MTPAKLRSLFCNPVNVRLEPYAPGIVNDELWVAAAAMLARREGVEQFLVNMLYTLQTALGVEGAAQHTITYHHRTLFRLIPLMMLDWNCRSICACRLRKRV